MSSQLVDRPAAAASDGLLASRVVVFNVRHRPPAGFTPVYVGRNMPGLAGHVLGNPFRVGRGYAHGEAAAASLPWLRAKFLVGGPERKALLDLASRIHAGEQLALGCWCAPRICHAEHVRAAVLGCARWLTLQQPSR